jgi:ParB-like chromosome segregation protein Spo0J
LKGGKPVDKSKIMVEELNVSSIRHNKILALETDRATVEMCKKAIDEYGVITMPVVGTLADGSRIILSGESEFAAIKEAGINKINATTAYVPEADTGGAKLSLLLSSIKKYPGALCEGMLLREALEGGCTRKEICKMLHRSTSWVSNRVALATRLDRSVQEMLTRDLLDARSAQEIARLPVGVQHDFAMKVVQEGLPKSSVEKLVSMYNTKSCPAEVQGQIANDPRMALARTDDRRVINVTGNPHKGPEGLFACIEAIKKPLAWLGKALYNTIPAEALEHRKTLNALYDDFEAAQMMIRRLVSPGKKWGAQDAN